MTEAEPTGETPLQVSLNRLPGVRRRGVLLIPALAMVVALVFPFPAHGRAWGALFDLAHAPSFFLVFVCIAALRDRRSDGEKAVSPLPWQIELQRLILLAAVLCGIGIVCELAQQLVARQPSLGDVAANCTGLLAGIFWCACRCVIRPRARILLTSIVPVLISIPCINPLLELRECRRQSQEFPLLASFERDRELSAWLPHEADVQPTTDWSSDGKQSLQIRARQATRFPGATFVWPVADWTGYSELVFEIRNPQTHDLTLGINISDSLHPASGFDPTDRFRRTIEIPSVSTLTVRMALSEIAAAPATRGMNMSEISMVDLYLPGAVHGTLVLLDNLRVVR